MGIDGTSLWKNVEKLSAPAFLIAGGLVAIATIAMGFVMITDRSQGLLTGLPTMVGLLISYIGMLGLYPKLASRRPRAALASVVLLLAPFGGIAFWLGHAIIIGQEPSFAGTLVGFVFAGFVLGIALLGATSYHAQVPSSRVGLALTAFAVPWVVLLGSGVIYGGAAPVWLDFIATGSMAVLLLVIGYLIRNESSSINRGEASPNPAG